MAREVLLPKTELHFMLIPDLNAYASVDTTPDFTLTFGDEYVVVWGSDEFTRTAFLFTQEDGSENGAECIAIGNSVAAGGSDNGDPFAVVYDATNSRMYYFSTDDTESRFVSVYRSYSDGIAIMNPHGTRVIYGEYDKIRVNRGIGPKTIYSMGEAEGKIVYEEELDFSKGNMTIKPEYGKLWNEVEIVAPENLRSEVIAEGVEIAGVEGSLQIPAPEELYVSLDFENDDMMEITPEGKTTYSKVTIHKPEALTPLNIVKGVEIAGITGEFEGASSTEFDDVLGRLLCKIDKSTNTITLYKAFFTYSNTDIVIPDTINDMAVIIDSKGV